MLTALALMLAQPADEAPPPPPASPPSMPVGEALETAIAARDAQLFEAAFEGCDPDAVGTIIGPDFTMLHDLGGLAVPSSEAFVASLQEQCDARLPGGRNAGYKNRREVVPGSRIVRRLGDWGALEEANHIFFEWRAGKAEDGAPSSGHWELVGGARYMHAWKWEPGADGGQGAFKLERSYSYDHGAVRSAGAPG
ncbi:DUF4440 domain-containing protein [Parerythrobacter jejuensis]|uniref:DUF4440 domain-containing protein n=1 Tax=Parerythrobacter jejuensis TaxID=795812 RepID=A0A845AWR9_9SPHN|nr:DUF4440 domain-containing protein [Parerythrobacter jejuensis]MXP31228.1 DUF4440 domain-containing protein [Parerythrobacter jejuensis]MXP33988.1 DUF4440 domain-containing protein [Parerythrobacter jejuensis]